MIIAAAVVRFHFLPASSAFFEAANNRDYLSVIRNDNNLRCWAHSAYVEALVRESGFFDRGLVLERRDVPERLSLGHGSEEPSHYLPAARLRQLADEEDTRGFGDGAEPVPHPPPDLPASFRHLSKPCLRTTNAIGTSPSRISGSPPPWPPMRRGRGSRGLRRLEGPEPVPGDLRTSSAPVRPRCIRLCPHWRSLRRRRISGKVRQNLTASPAYMPVGRPGIQARVGQGPLAGGAHAFRRGVSIKMPGGRGPSSPSSV